MVVLAVLWAVFGVGAAVYVRALRRAQALSLPVPPLSPGGTATFRAGRAAPAPGAQRLAGPRRLAARSQPCAAKAQ